MAKITTLLLDCDNTLVLSESIAFEACATLANSILRQHDINPIPEYTGPTLMAEFVGQNFRGMLLSLMKKHNLTIPDAELADYVSKEEDAVISAMVGEPGLQPCDGVFGGLDLAKKQGYELAVVSSSALRRVNASLQKVGLDKYIPDGAVFSAATSLPVPTSKPDPAIYLHALEKLGKRAEECVAVEDSKSGTLSARRAGIRVLGYTGCYEGEEKEEMKKVLEENGAGVVMGHWSEFESALEEVSKAKL